MSCYIYDDSSTFAGPPRRLDSADGTARWLEHFSNSLILNAFLQRAGTPSEKAQIQKEMSICERKMAFWRRHPRFVQKTASDEAQKLRSAWAQSRGGHRAPSVQSRS